MRTFKFSFVAALALLPAGCARHDVVAVLKDKTMVAGPACEFPRLANFKLEKFDGLWTVPARINEYNVRLAVDTGASDVFISPMAATAMSLQENVQNIKTSTSGLGGGSDLSKPVETEHFVIGGFDIRNEMVALAATAIKYDISPPLVGLLGRSYLGAFDVELDFPQSRMALYGSRHCKDGFLPWTEPYIALTIKESVGDKIFFDVKLDGKTLEAMLDTGSEVTILSSVGARAMGLSNAMIKSGPQFTLITTDGHNARAFVHNFHELEVGGQRWENPKLAVQTYAETDGPDSSMPGFRETLTWDRRRFGAQDLNSPIILGLDFLDRRKIWISFATMQVFISSVIAPDRPSGP